VNAENEEYKDLLAQLAQQAQRVREATREIKVMWENAANAENQAQSELAEKRVLKEIVGNEENKDLKDFKVLKENKAQQD
jgi:hypothetical protein